MTSPSEHPELPYLVPELADEVKAECVGGVYEIQKPTAQEYKFDYHGHPPVDSIQLRCQSLFAKRPNVLCKCNSLVKTIVGNGSGDQTELIECGRCRTSYLVRTKYENGKCSVRVDVWDLSRKLKQYADLKRDKDFRIWVSFHEDKK